MRQGYAVHELHARRRRHLVPRRRRPALVPDGRAPAGRAAARHPGRPAARVRRGRGSPLLPSPRASIRSRSAARSSATSPTRARVEGGSTLTQQLARTLFLSNQKTYGRKLREAVLALMIDAQLSKEQILELYLNRIYLSAGVYGVETMSRHLFGKPAKQLNLAESRADRGLARAPAALSPWTNLDGAVARSHVVLARMREEGFITAAQEQAARARAASASGRIPGATDPRGRLREGVPAPAVPRRASAAIIRPTGTCGRRSCRSCRTWRSARCRDGLRRFGEPRAAGGARRDRSARPATSSRSSAAATSGSRSSTARAAAGGSPDRRSSRSSTPRRSSTASRRCRCSTGLATIAPQGPEEWAPRNAGGETPGRADAARRAARIEQPRRDGAAAARRDRAPVLRLASDVGLRDLPDVPSLSLGTGLVTPLDLTAAFAMFPNGGFAVQPARHRARPRRRRRHRARQPGRRPSG